MNTILLKYSLHKEREGGREGEGKRERKKGRERERERERERGKGQKVRGCGGKETRVRE